MSNILQESINRKIILSNDLQKLNQIKSIYDSMTSDYLTAGFYSEFMDIVNYQISEIEKAIKRLKINN